MGQPGVSVSDEENCMMVKLEGSARVETAILLKQKLAQSQIAREVAIDWGEAEHVDASVLQVLLVLGKSLAERGSRIVVDQDNPRVREYLKLSGLSEYFPVREQPLPVPPAEAAHA